MKQSYAAKSASEAPKVQQEQKQAVKVVEVQGLVLLKIIKHCKESLPTLATGQLLGLDVGGTLEITNCFPFPESLDDGVDGGAAYQFEMMKSLREVNTDNNTVGWYQSSVHGAYQTVELLTTFVNYEDQIPKSVCLIFDSQRQSYGQMPLKAVRLRHDFMKQYTAEKLTADDLQAAGITWKKLFQEIPIHVTNTLLATTMIKSLAPDVQCTQGELDRLSLHVGPYQKKLVNILSETMEELIEESGKVGNYQKQVQKQQSQYQQWLAKRKAENQARIAAGDEPLPEEDPNLFKKPEEPTQLVTYLLTNQVHNYCGQVSAYAAQSLQKTYLMAELQRSEQQ